MEFKVGDDGIMRFPNRICVPYKSEVKNIILDEGHVSNLNIHQGYTKTHQNCYEDILVVRHEEECH